ncbi:MAG: peptidylprolyl isomerase [Ignavibacteria bacterium]|nr:peptidylprolyl isomerase [Ignavibacteria bacterium]
MPLMTQIRERLTTFFSVFAGLFVVYIVLDWGMDITGRRHSSRTAESQEIGKINDQPILARDFSEMVRRAIDNQKTQSGTEPDENQQRAIRDQIWNQLIDQTLYDEEIKRLGITVTDQEIVDWVKGENPPDFLKQQFTDSTGTFNRQVYEQTIMDPKNKAIMVRVEDALRKQRQREKLQSIIMASVQVDEEDIRQKFIDQHINFEADYILLDPNLLVKDDEVKVTDDDLRKYYNEHSDEYKVEASRKLKYVLFNEVPSKSDTAGVLSDIEDILKRANAGVDFSDLAKTYSENPPNDTTYFKHGQLTSDKENALFAAKIGDIIGPVKEADGYRLMKVLDFRPSSEEAIHASHILINIQNNDSAKALKEAKDVAAAARRGEDFGELAKKHSKDPGSAARGGDLGWFAKGRMVKQFEEAAFKTKPGQITGPVRTQSGYHIIKVIAKDNREVKYSEIHLVIKTSSQTRSDVSQRAQDFAYLAKQGSFEKEAEQSKYTLTETPSFQKNAVIPGIGMNTTANKFAFSNKVGTVSEPISLTNGTAVFMVSEVKEAGIRPFDELRASIETRVKRDKKMEKVKSMATEIRQSLATGDSLNKVVRSHPNLSVQHLPSFTLGGFLPGIGRDPSFIGCVAALKSGEISKPVEGNRGMYVVKLTSESGFDTSAYNNQKETSRAQLLSEKKNRFFSEWSDHLKKSADIVDNRDIFYR